MPIASPIPIIGPINGDISMAPIITAVELVLSPKDAMNMATIDYNVNSSERNAFTYCGLRIGLRNKEVRQVKVT